jgi:hypothetical protein
MSDKIEASAAQRVATQHNVLQHSTTRCNTAHHVAAQYTTLQHSPPRCNTAQRVATQHTAGSTCSYERWVSKQRQAREHDAAVAAQVPAPPRTTVQYRRLHSMHHTAQPHQPADTAGLRARVPRGTRSTGRGLDPLVAGIPWHPATRHQAVQGGSASTQQYSCAN